MIYRKLELSVDYAKAGYRDVLPEKQPYLELYLHDVSREMPGHTARPAMVVFPGGGYAFTSDREAEPVALRFFDKGFNCFVLRYSVVPVRFPCALLEAATAILTVRRHAEEWQIDPANVTVCGFSAGGHLAAESSVHWKLPLVFETLGCTPREVRPDAAVLCYPVITPNTDRGHTMTFKNLLGDRYEEEGLLDLVTLDKQVDSETPPTFLWHTFNDGCVPVENSLEMASALRRVGVAFEMHILPDGEHGLSLANEEVCTPMPSCADWPDQVVRFIRDLHR